MRPAESHTFQYTIALPQRKSKKRKAKPKATKQPKPKREPKRDHEDPKNPSQSGRAHPAPADLRHVKEQDPGATRVCATLRAGTPT